MDLKASCHRGEGNGDGYGWGARLAQKQRAGMLPVGFGEVQGGHVSQRLKLSNAVVAKRYDRDRKRKRGKGKKVVGLVLLAAAHASCAIRGQNHQCHVSYGIREIGLQRDIVF